MASYRVLQGFTGIAAPTNANWGQGFFLLMIGATLAVPVPYLLELAERSGPPWDHSVALGLCLGALGLL